jgi:hypothetical protein
MARLEATETTGGERHMTNITKFKPRNSVGVPTWVLVFSNMALRDEWNRLEGQDGTIRFNIYHEIDRREKSSAWTEGDWTAPGPGKTQ